MDLKANEGGDVKELVCLRKNKVIKLADERTIQLKGVWNNDCSFESEQDWLTDLKDYYS